MGTKDRTYIMLASGQVSRSSTFPQTLVYPNTGIASVTPTNATLYIGILLALSAARRCRMVLYRTFQIQDVSPQPIL